MKIRLRVTKLKILIKQNVLALSVLISWFGLGTVIFYVLHGHDLLQAVKYAFYLSEPSDPSSFSNGYSFLGPVALIPIILSIFMYNLERKFKPELGCRLMAKEMKGHIVVIGYTHLGKRLVKIFQSKEVPYVLIEEDKNLVDDLVKSGEPVVVGDARESDALKDAGVQDAKTVIITFDDLRHIFPITKRVREMNKDCFLIVRCFEDELTEALESLGANMVISSSKKASEDIIKTLHLKTT